MRQPNPAASFGVSERVYAMDAKGSAVVAATADKQMHVFDMNCKFFFSPRFLLFSFMIT
jgi:hypothetical protein